jgi:D-lactate dehydrogenase (cytochrome)
VTRVEFLDAWIVAAVNAYSETSYPEEPCLFIEASGSEALVLADLELVQAIATAEGATEIITERDPDARSRLWKARHEAANATAAKFAGTKERATDVCVPLTELAGAAHFARAEIERLGLNAGIVGHAGDGNLHIAVQVEASEIDRSEELVHNVVDDALARGGTCTGEHGIGLGKIGALEQEHGDLIPLMQAIKASFDPSGILNPGKVLPGGAAAEPAPRV